MTQEHVVAIPSARPRCYLLYALAPEGIKASIANRLINELIGDPDIPLALWHDHFLGEPGGTVVFYVENEEQQKALFGNTYLVGWNVDYRPMVFSFSPAAFDAQIAYTVKSYAGVDWETIRNENRPDYDGRDAQKEVETAEESW